MPSLINTNEVIKQGEYFSSGKDFFGNFKEAWGNVQYQILKLETRQTYQEPGNKSLDLLLNENDLEGAVALLDEVRDRDRPLYKSLRERGVDFIRCRPISFPVTTYLQWELECYGFNSKYCERIFLSKKKETHIFIEKYALHDFMVFDSSIAFIHNYDATGLIQGGWKITNHELIKNLIFLYSIIKADCLEYRTFLKNENYSIIYK